MSDMTRIAVYDYVESAVNTVAHPVYCSSLYEPKLPSLPACCISEISTYRPKRSLTLDNNDGVRNSTFEVQVFTNKANNGLSEAEAIIGYADGAFRALGYIKTIQREVENIDRTILRIVSRYERTIGDGDDMPSATT